MAVEYSPSDTNCFLTFHVTTQTWSNYSSDLEFKLIYVGSAESEAHDQILESVMVGPVPVGVNKFVLQADPPKTELLPPNDILGVTVLLMTCSYLDKEFIRVGYYVNTDYTDELLKETPPPVVEFEKLERSILADKPRVTRFNIPWDNPIVQEESPKLQEAAMLEQQMGVTFQPPGPLDEPFAQAAHAADVEMQV
ncbi:ASF1 anti-silencing function 1 [Chytridiales sp. JEL 0842]|nr:ASF1 anti-silencing function 1 [Chytridiales sp. JEL 0842]